MTKIKSLISGILLAFCAQAQNDLPPVFRPTGLTTDLLEHTDRTWCNGYVTNTPVWALDKAIEPLQYVEIASAYPSFGWIVPGTEQDVKQTAYRILVADTREDALATKGTVWDSGEVSSDRSVAIAYDGEALQGGKTHFWRVRTTTTEGSEWSDVKAFRTAATLKPYAASAYPIEKTAEHPVAVREMDSAYFIDFGRDAFGQLLVGLTSATGRDSVIVHLGECLSGERIDRDPGGSRRYQKYVIHLMKGTHTYRVKIAPDGRNTSPGAILMPAYIGEVLPFRYCEITHYGLPLTTMDIIRESVHYPFDDMAATFKCSNDTINQIWELCKYSIKATSFLGIYVDGDRERIPYEADAFINQLGHYATDREYSMARRSVEYLLYHPTWPTEWILQGVLLAWNDYLYTGDSRSLQANYEMLKTRALGQLTEKNGFISTTTGLQTPAFIQSIGYREKIRDIVDWPGNERDEFVFTDYNVVINAYRYEALKQMAQIAAALGRTDEAADFAKQAAKFKANFNKRFFNGKTGAYRDGLTTEHSSLHGNMFPLAFGMVEDAQKTQVMNFVRSRGMACSVYGSQFLMDALYEAGDADYALSMLTKTDDRSWYNMIHVGSTISLEAWDNKYKPNQDWNHAWGAAPANIIPRKLMGIEPLTPGFGVARIKPQIGSLRWAQTIVPTVRGGIQVSIAQIDDYLTMQVIIPANMEADVYLPLPRGNYSVSCNGKIIPSSPVKGEPFLSVGRVSSGEYRYMITP